MPVTIRQIAAAIWLMTALVSVVEADRDVGDAMEAYQRCIGCHAPAYNRTGPLHCGLLGRRAGTITGYGYTQAMKQSGIVWNRQTLDEFLRAPLKMVPGTSMGFAGVASDSERKRLIDYLSTLDGNSPACR